MYSYELLMLAIKLIAAGLATHYVTYALTMSNGPWDVFDKLAAKKGSPTHCYTCTAFWVGLVFTAAVYFGVFWLAVPFAVAGIAQLVHSATR